MSLRPANCRVRIAITRHASSRVVAWPHPRSVARALAAFAACVALGASAAGTAADGAAPDRSAGEDLAMAAWSTHGGGANVAGGSFTGTVSLAQVERPVAPVGRGGAFELSAGWLSRAVTRSDELFRDSFEP